MTEKSIRNALLHIADHMFDVYKNNDWTHTEKCQRGTHFILIVSYETQMSCLLEIYHNQ